MTTCIQLRLPTERAQGHLSVAGHPRAVVLLAHGPDSSRHSLGSRLLAEGLAECGFATCPMDLLIEDDRWIDLHTRGLRADPKVMARRLVEAVDLLGAEPATAGLPVGTFGIGWGAAAALVASAERPGRVAAVLACDGRIDQVADVLPRVRAPVLLVGGADTPGAVINERAAWRLPNPTLSQLPDGSKPRLEPDGLEDVMALTTGWFRRCLG